MQCAWCGHEYTEELGKYGCPNCLAEGLDSVKCPVCKGHGADPGSDNLNFLPCQNCGGTGEITPPPKRRCPHDDQICRHHCEGSECWRELDGS